MKRMRSVRWLLAGACILSLGLFSCGESEPPQEGEAYSPAQFDKMLQANKIIVVDFKADWCVPCKQLAPKLERIAAAHADSIMLKKVDVDLSRALADSLRINSIPYVAKFVNGVKVKEFMGNVDDATIEALFKP